MGTTLAPNLQTHKLRLLDLREGIPGHIGRKVVEPGWAKVWLFTEPKFLTTRLYFYPSSLEVYIGRWPECHFLELAN